MSQPFDRCLRYVPLVVCAAVIASAAWASAAVLTPDPDFGLQTLGSPIGSPWTPVSGSGNAAAASAQSPFTNVFAANGIGANTPATGANPYIVGMFGPAIPAGATGQLYFNADFRNNTTHGADYSLVVTNGANGALRTSTLYVTGGALFADSNVGAGVPIMSLTPGTWYNAQLTLNLTNNTYSGTVTQFGGPTTIIPSRGFVTENPINCIYTDGGTSLITGTAPDHDIDNFALSTPPPPAPLENVVNIDFNGFRLVPGPDVMGPTYSGVGAAGGGNVFNGLAADSTGGNDNLTVSATGLLDSYGSPTMIDFTVLPVGGDVGGPATTDPTSYEALFSDYVFDHSAGNDSDSPFTITFGGLAISADLYFYRATPDSTITVDGATPASFDVNGIFSNGNTLFFPDVPVVNGAITGHFGYMPNGTAVIQGLSVVAKVPEPGSFLLLVLGGLGLLFGFRRRATKAARAEASR